MYYTTSIPTLVADVTIKNLADGKVRAVAIGVNPEDDTRYTDLGYVTSRACSIKRRELAVNEVRAKLEACYRRLYGDDHADEAAMNGAFEHVKDEVLNGNKRLHGRWKGDSTNKNAITFFERNVLSLILPYADPSKSLFLPEDRNQIEEELRFLAESRNGGDSANAAESAQKRLREADIIYNHMRGYDGRLPELKFSSDEPYKRAPKKEQLKHLSLSIMWQFFAKLAELVEKSPRFVFFCVFVIYGLRPAEAAARKPSEIAWCDKYCVVEVKSQERKGLIDPRLKNKYSKRPVVISYWGYCLLRRCCELIGEDYPHDEQSMNISEECADRVKTLLLACGCSDELIVELGESIDKDDLDTDDEKDPTQTLRKEKVTCYILRRNFATIMRSQMGLSLFMTDRMLGHIPTGNLRRKEAMLDHEDMNSPDTQKAIAAMMERFIFDPDVSLNPSCTPYALHDQMSLDIIEFSRYEFVNDTNHVLSVRCNMEAAETGEQIIMEMPQKMKRELVSFSRPKSWEGRDHTIIGESSYIKERDYQNEEERVF